MDDYNLSQFCQPCGNALTDCIRHGWDQAEAWYRHYAARDQPLQKGCWLCTRFNQMRPQSPDENSNENDRLSFYCLKQEKDTGLHHFQFHSGGNSLDLVVTSLPSNPELEVFQTARRSLAEPWTGGPHAATLSASWLSTCLDHHASCKKISSSNWRPSRLLEVRGDEVRLLLTATESIIAPYATLSHCWGKAEFLVLTSTTLPCFLAGIATDKLPLTFQQTITTIQRLGIRYLWIDCYCIIQGADPLAQADWAFESEQMNQVYSNSLLNIGAADAKGPHYGLFSQRQLPFTCSLPFWLQPSPETSGTWYVLTMQDIQPPLSMAIRELQGNTLMKRAWVLQECVFSPRMLSFTQSQLIWQCSEMAACEVFPWAPVGYKYDWIGTYPFWALTQDLIASNIVPSSEFCGKTVQDTQRSLHYRWFLTLMMYTHAELTYPDKDILRAIDGVGKTIAALTNDTYSCGLLLKTMPFALLWWPNDGHPNRSRRAPSWHWASWDGTVMHYYAKYPKNVHWKVRPLTYFIMTTDYRTSLSDVQSVSEPWPQLVGIARLLDVELVDKNAIYGQHCPGRYLATKRGLIIKVPRNRPSELKSQIWLDHEAGAHIENDEAIPSFEEYRSIALLPVTSLLRGTTVERISCLIVQDTGKGTFRRVGMYVHYTEEGDLEELSMVKPNIIVLD